MIKNRYYKKTFFLSALLFSAAFAQVPDGYKLAWSDEFNTTTLNTSEWYYRTDAKHQSVQLRENVTFDGISLVLNLTELSQPIQGKKYAGAGIVTKKRFRYGYYEVRAKMGDAINHDGDNLTDEGWHHAFWAMLATPTNGSIENSFTPGRRTEIDCYEYTDNFTVDSSARFTQHIIVWKEDGSEWGRLPTPPEDLNDLYGFNTNNWHTYAFKWNAKRVCFFINGKLTKVAEYPAESFLHDSINVWLTAMSANWTDPDPEKSEARYDYFRFYEVDASNPPVPPEKPANVKAEAGKWTVSLSWSKNPELNIFSYFLFRRESTGGPFKKIAELTDTAYFDYDVQSGQKYYYSVTAFDSTGEESERSLEVSATPQGGTRINVAKQKNARADSEFNATYTASKAVDGNITDNNSRWLSADRAYPHWIEVDLQKEYSISMVKIYTGWNGYNGPISDFQFQYWSNNQWVNILSVKDNANPESSHGFMPVTTDKVRLYATKGSSENVLRLYELEVYGQDPTPIDKQHNRSMGQSNTLFQNRPNPFNALTKIHLRLADQAKVHFAVYSVSGQMIYSRKVYSQNPGMNVLTWNGRNEKGEEVPAGVYFYRVTVKSARQTWHDTKQMMVTY